MTVLWNVVMSGVMEFCDDKGMELCDEKGMEQCHERFHGAF